MAGNPWGWAGSVREFLSVPMEQWLAALSDHHRRLWLTNPAGSQVEAWRVEHGTMTSALRQCVEADPDEAVRWSVVFEYELPMEGGRRPDVVVLAGGSLVVLEFKSTAGPSQADIDQTAGYLRDLSDYHAESHGLLGHALLVCGSAPASFARKFDEVTAISPDFVYRYLYDAKSVGAVDLISWLNAAYRPLPSLVDAARRIFRDEPLPHVRKAEAVGVPETVDLLGRLVDDCAESGGRLLAFVTGVPGAGKTLVGLRLVYERAETHGHATFLSGNGPLVQVLQDALQSRVFVRDLHAFIKTYALNQRRRIPEEHVVVFDEAQRAWDAKYMHEKKGIARSEPDLLIEIGNSIEGWSVLVGLVGEGQEIHSGEEAGLDQWRNAVATHAGTSSWRVHCAPSVAPLFSGLDVTSHEELNLDVTLRSHRAEDLHQWVRLLLEGSISLAHRQAVRFQRLQYPVYLTRDLAEAKEYVRHRFENEPAKRCGLLASSHAKSLPKYDVDNSYMATSRMKVARWYNADPRDALSSNALVQPVTEFGCQGLELDLPILCWGEDYRWDRDAWRLTPIRRRYQQEDPHALLRNAYRVLLTRGRDGLVIFLPSDPRLDATELILLAAGVRHIPSDEELMAEDAVAG